MASIKKWTAAKYPKLYARLERVNTVLTVGKVGGHTVSFTAAIMGIWHILPPHFNDISKGVLSFVGAFLIELLIFRFAPVVSDSVFDIARNFTDKDGNGASDNHTPLWRNATTLLIYTPLLIGLAYVGLTTSITGKTKYVEKQHSKEIVVNTDLTAYESEIKAAKQKFKADSLGVVTSLKAAQSKAAGAAQSKIAKHQKEVNRLANHKDKDTPYVQKMLKMETKLLTKAKKAPAKIRQSYINQKSIALDSIRATEAHALALAESTKQQAGQTATAQKTALEDKQKAALNFDNDLWYVVVLFCIILTFIAPLITDLSRFLAGKVPVLVTNETDTSAPLLPTLTEGLKAKWYVFWAAKIKGVIGDSITITDTDLTITRTSGVGDNTAKPAPIAVSVPPTVPPAPTPAPTPEPPKPTKAKQPEPVTAPEPPKAEMPVINIAQPPAPVTNTETTIVRTIMVQFPYKEFYGNARARWRRSQIQKKESSRKTNLVKALADIAELCENGYTCTVSDEKARCGTTGQEYSPLHVTPVLDGKGHAVQPCEKLQEIMGKYTAEVKTMRAELEDRQKKNA